MFDIITDSACDLTLDTAKQLQIEVVPFYVSLDGEHYRKEGKEIAVRDFYQFMVDNPSAYPKTSLAGRRLHAGRDCDMAGSRESYQPDLLHGRQSGLSH